LGTTGNTPGPTAAKAQLLYDKMQEDAELSALRKRRRGVKNFDVANWKLKYLHFYALINLSFSIVAVVYFVRRIPT
jgi:hypothetical protein